MSGIANALLNDNQQSACVYYASVLREIGGRANTGACYSCLLAHEFNVT